jgi:hypothetical protein
MVTVTMRNIYKIGFLVVDGFEPRLRVHPPLHAKARALPPRIGEEENSIGLNKNRGVTNKAYLQKILFKLY